MKKKEIPNKSLTKYSIMVIVFVISVILLGVSLSYAYFTAYFNGISDTTPGKAAILDVTTTLTSVPVINAARLALIEAPEYKEKAEKIEFSVTNEATSNINAKYTLKLVEMSLTKNLFSQYFKWKIVVNEDTSEEKSFTGDFSDESITPEGTNELDKVTDLTKMLLNEDEALTLEINKTDQIKFYIWLENAENIDQIYLTNGEFQGKLSMDAVPTK